MFTLTIETDNAAFEDDAEIARILRKTADDVDGLSFSDTVGGNLFDVNGNNVGEWKLTR